MKLSLLCLYVFHYLKKNIHLLLSFVPTESEKQQCTIRQENRKLREKVAELQRRIDILEGRIPQSMLIIVIVLLLHYIAYNA